MPLFCMVVDHVVEIFIPMESRSCFGQCAGVSILSFCASESTVQVVTDVFLALHAAHTFRTLLQGTYHAHPVCGGTIHV